MNLSDLSPALRKRVLAEAKPSGSAAVRERANPTSRKSGTERGPGLPLRCRCGFRAGFEVVGVDIKAQPNYPFEFHQADALEVAHWVGFGWDKEGWFRCGDRYVWPWFDAIHASPVCYAWSKMRDCRPGTKDDQPDLITPLRPLLRATGLPYVIENVPGAPLLNPVRICGSGLGMTLQRHREFECSFPVWGVTCAHGQNAWNPAYKHATGRKRRRVPVIGEWRVPFPLQCEAMGIDWMTLEELTEAIPPAYTTFIGRHLLEALEAAA